MTAPSPAAHDMTLVLSKSLFDVLKDVPDPRQLRGQRHSIQALLALLVLSFLTGGQTVKDAVLLGRNYSHLRPALGFTHRLCPSQSTYTRLFKVLPVATVREAVARWLAALADLHRRQDRAVVAAVDGKAVRGGGAYTLNIFAHDFFQLLDQLTVEGAKENEMSVFRAAMDDFLDRYPFVRILTFDAIFCEQKTMEALTRHNRMGIFQVKENQPETLFMIQRFFDKLLASKPDDRVVEKKWRLRRHARHMGGACAG